MEGKNQRFERSIERTLVHERTERCIDGRNKQVKKQTNERTNRKNEWNLYLSVEKNCSIFAFNTSLQIPPIQIQPQSSYIKLSTTAMIIFSIVIALVLSSWFSIENYAKIYFTYLAVDITVIYSGAERYLSRKQNKK